MKQQAIFLDRDGVISELIFNPKTQAFEAPHDLKDLRIIDGVFEALQEIQKRFKLFVVSNQPDYAKGTSTLESIKEIINDIQERLAARAIRVEEFFYCYHHPQGVVPGYAMDCECRKPKPYFLLKAAREHNIDLGQSWMIGDQDTDIECGQGAGVKTVLVMNENSKTKRGKSKPTLVANNLKDAILLIENYLKTQKGE